MINGYFYFRRHDLAQNLMKDIEQKNEMTDYILNHFSQTLSSFEKEKEEK